MRIRITFSKTGPLIYIGNLDLLTIWERAARRADLPLEYTRAFHPTPKIHLAVPLPLGFSSSCEVLDMRLQDEVDLAGLAARLQPTLPAGLEIIGVDGVDPSSPALQSQVEAAEYEVGLLESADPAGLEEKVTAMLAAPSIPRMRRGKAYDLRPLIQQLSLAQPAGQSRPRIRMRLTAREGATGRPDEVVEALGLSREDTRIQRTALIFRPQSLQ